MFSRGIERDEKVSVLFKRCKTLFTINKYIYAFKGYKDFIFDNFMMGCSKENNRKGYKKFMIITDVELYFKLRKTLVLNTFKVYIFLYSPLDLLSQLHNSIRWSSYILFKLVNFRLALLTLNAYISTLGGGYFLCRYMGQAESLAKLQMQVADYLDDPVLKAQCKVHLIYNRIARGKLKSAQNRINKLKQVALNFNDTSLMRMLVSAESYVRNVKRISHKLRSDDNPAKMTQGDYVRQIFVQ